MNFFKSSVVFVLLFVQADASQVAVCLSGGLRTFPVVEVHTNIYENLIAPLKAAGHEVDVYMDFPRGNRAGEHLGLLHGGALCESSVLNGRLASALALFKPVRVRQFSASCLNTGNAQLQLMVDCFDMVTGEYDFFIRTRPDVVFFAPIPVDELLVDAIAMDERQPFNDNFFAFSARQKQKWWDAWIRPVANQCGSMDCCPDYHMFGAGSDVERVAGIVAAELL